MVGTIEYDTIGKEYLAMRYNEVGFFLGRTGNLRIAHIQDGVRDTMSPSLLITEGNMILNGSTDEHSTFMINNLDEPNQDGDAATKYYVDNIIKYHTNPNLLDNWYFGNPINQRNGYIVPAGVDYYTFTWEKVGQTDKNYQVLLRRDAKNNYDCEIEINGIRYVVGGANSVPGYCGDRYTVDRWHLTTDGVLTVADEGIRLTSGALFEPFGYEFSSLLKGKTVTYSFFFADNTLVTKSAVIPSTWGNWDSLIEIGDIQLIGLESGKRIWARYSSTTTAVAAKLELGDTQTLAHKEGDKWVLNEIPDFGEQLRRCTYYAEKVESDDTPAITNSAFVPSGATSAVFILPYARKRTVPVVHFNDVSNYRVIARSISGETTAFSVTSISLLDIGRTKAAILVSFNATDKGYYCFLQRQDNTTDGYAFISADI